MNKQMIRNFRKSLRRFERMIELMNFRCCIGVTAAQCQVLLELEDLKETTTKELSRILKLDKSTLSRTVDSLVNLGLTKRRSHTTDRRFTILKLTPKGEKICEEINQANDHIYDQFFKKIPAEQFNDIMRNFERLVYALTEYYHEEINGDTSSCRQEY